MSNIKRPLLSVKDLCVDSSRHEILHGIGFEIYPEERFGLIGESGSGKSITALTLLGLLPPGFSAKGEVLLSDPEETNLLALSQRKLDHIRGTSLTAVFQEPLTALDPLMLIGRQIEWPLRHHQKLRGSELRNKVVETLSEVQLPDPERIARFRIGDISGGQRQRVALALALACKPKLLIADEPTTALDVTVQAEILDLIDNKIREYHMALLLISHDLGVVARMADSLAVIHSGRIIETGTSDQILHDPKQEETRQLRDSALELQRHLPKREPK